MTTAARHQQPAQQVEQADIRQAVVRQTTAENPHQAAWRQHSEQEQQRQSLQQQQEQRKQQEQQQKQQQEQQDASDRYNV
jgi:cell division protein FtsN